MEKQALEKRRPWRGAASKRDEIQSAIAKATQGWRRCLREFAVWLEEGHGLALSTIVIRVVSTRSFVEAQNGCGVCCLRLLDVNHIEDFFIGYAKAHGPHATRTMQAGMRLFLRFAAARKWVANDLADAVPSMRSYRLSHVPRGLSAKQVRALIVSSAEESARDYAIVLLLAVYGVRRSQVSTLRLQDIDWRRRTIAFGAHKGGKPVDHTLAPAVGATLSEYLLHERPNCNEDTVFLRSRAPHLPLGPGAVSMVIRSLMQRSSLACTPCGPHALRHAFATRLLHKGQSLKVIADLLGHRSLQAVSIYAKVDHPRLLEVAVHWPEETP